MRSVVIYTENNAMEEINNHNIYTIRRNNKKVPSSRKAVLNQLYDAQNMTFNEERLIFVPESKTFAAFTSETNLKMLCCNSVQLIGDEMISCIPKYFPLLYTIHGYKKGLFIPLVFVLIANNKEKTYANMWIYIKQLCKDFNLTLDPKMLMVDFDKNIYKSILSVFPNCQLVGSRFHVAKAWHRKLNTDVPDIRDHYNDGTSEIGNWLRTFFGLPFLPPFEISEAFCELISEAPEYIKALMKFPDHILINYMGEDSRSNVLYPTETWAKQPSNSFDGTINEIQSFYPQLNELYSNNHSTIWDVVHIFKKMQADTYFKIENTKLKILPILDQDHIEKLKFNYSIWCKYTDGIISRYCYLNTFGHIYNFVP